MEAALVIHMLRPVEHHYAVGTALAKLAHDANFSVRDPAKAVGLSQRRFIQVFAAEVGLTPGKFSRVQRFRRALGAIPKGGAPDWAAVAADCGYFDQSHFIHDFRAFSGLSPTQYLRQRSERAKEHHVPLAE
jgi:transcriptional regulator GlxA family with amidase domain